MRKRSKVKCSEENRVNEQRCGAKPAMSSTHGTTRRWRHVGTRGPMEQSTSTQYQHGWEAQASPSILWAKTSLATSGSLLPPVMLLQLLQLLLHEVGLSSGLRELERTANNRSELKAREAFPNSQHNRDFQPQARSCRREFVPVEQGGSCHVTLH